MYLRELGHDKQKYWSCVKLPLHLGWVLEVFELWLGGKLAQGEDCEILIIGAPITYI